MAGRERQPKKGALKARSIALRWMSASLVAAGVWSATPDAHACQACACGDATFAIDPAKGDAHTLVVQLQAATRPERYGADGYPYEFGEWRADLTLGWAYQRTMLALRLPWLWRTLDYEGMELAQTSGFGDMELAASWVFARSFDRDDAWELQQRGASQFGAIHGGLSMPTGAGIRDARGELLVDDVQPGTGSFTLFAGVNWSVTRGIFAVDGRHTAYVPMPGRFQFQVGPTWQNRVRALVTPVAPLTLGVGFYGSLASPVKYDGEPEVDTGGFAGYLDVEAEVRAHRSVAFIVGARVPVIQALKGDHRAQTGVFFGVRLMGEVGASTAVDWDEGGYVL